MTSPAARGIALAQVHQLGVGLRQHRRQPFALDVQGGAQPLVGQLAGQRGRRRWRCRSSPSGAVHSITPVDAREIHRTHHAASRQRLGRSRIRSRRGPGRRRSARTGSRSGPTGTACPTGTAGATAGSKAKRTPSPHDRLSPAWWISSSTISAPSHQPAQRARVGRHLLVGDHHAVHVGGQQRRSPPTTRDPGGGPAARPRAPTAASGAGSAPRSPPGGPGPPAAPAAPRASANRVLPAPGVATARKFGDAAALEARQRLALPRAQPQASAPWLRARSRPSPCQRRCALAGGAM